MTSELVLDRAAADGAHRPPIGRRILAPVAVTAGALAVLGSAQLLFDPFAQHVPLCPVHALTGLWCPGCGMTRAVHALLAADPLLALRSNALVLVLVPAALYGWGRWFRGRLRGAPLAVPHLGTRSRVALVLLAVLALAYAVARNVPALAVLAPAAA